MVQWLENITADAEIFFDQVPPFKMQITPIQVKHKTICFFICNNWQHFF